MTIHAVPPGTLSNTDSIVTGFKLSEQLFFNSPEIPQWLKEEVPPYIPVWDRRSKDPKETGSHHHVFGSRKRPIELVSAEGLPKALALSGFTPSACRVKRVRGKRDKEYLALSITWTRPALDDSIKRVELVDVCQELFKQLQLKYSWSAYAKELVDDDGTHVLAVNFATPVAIIPSRRNYEITIAGEMLVINPHPARTLFD